MTKGAVHAHPLHGSVPQLARRSGGSRAYGFAQRWAAAGHKVTLLAGNLNHKTLSTITSPTVSPEGVTVVRVRTYNKIRGSYVRRIANFLCLPSARL